MKFAVELGSGAMICITSFITIGSDFQKFIGEGTETHRDHDDLISLFVGIFNKGSRLKYH